MSAPAVDGCSAGGGKRPFCGATLPDFLGLPINVPDFKGDSQTATAAALVVVYNVGEGGTSSRQNQYLFRNSSGRLETNSVFFSATRIWVTSGAGLCKEATESMAT